MLLQFHAHQTSRSDAAPQVHSALEDLRGALEALPYLFWPDKSAKLQTEALSANKEKQLRQQESLQSLYNTWLKQELVERGFEAECLVRDVRQSSDRQKTDFAKRVENGRRIFVEVEFGYTASIERNLFKLADAYHHGRSALGVMICPVNALAKATASGVATFETAVERLRAFHPNTLPVPLLVIGLDHRGEQRIDMSKSQLPGPLSLSGNNSKEVLWHVASELRAGVCVDTIGLPSALARRQAVQALKLRSTVDDLQTALSF